MPQERGSAVRELLDAVLMGVSPDDSPVTHVEILEARAGEAGAWPSWAAPALVAALEARGVAAPWRHQVAAAELAWAGQSVVLATGTGSGKSLGYQLPALTQLLADDRS